MIAFAVAALLLIMVPGPDQALVTRNSLVGGRRAGLLTMLGGVAGLTVHATAAVVGLSALLLASATAFNVLKLVGAAYLLWLALQMMRSAMRSETDDPDASLSPTAPHGWVCLRQGFLSNALNPKVGLFFVTFLPQFLSADARSPRLHGLMLSAIFATLYLAWFSLYVAAVEKFGRWLRRPRVKARIERVTGGLLAVVAVRLATTNH